MATAFFDWLFRRAPQTPVNPPKFPYTVETNPYRTKRAWPPDFTQLSQTHQFRLERRYRRRSQLKFKRPVWDKSMQALQWSLVSAGLIWGVLFMEDPNGLPSIFQPFRNWVFGHVGGGERMRNQSVETTAPPE